jgi:Ca-activated chloride channel homolog
MRLPAAVVMAGTVLLVAACAAPQHEEADRSREELRDQTAAGTIESDAVEIAVSASNVAPPPGQTDGRARSELVGREAKQTMIGGVPPASAAALVCCLPRQAVDTERYEHFDENAVHLVADDPVSTFSIDVDTGSYANVRRFLTAGTLPPQDAVRIEEMLNYFDYSYDAPRSPDTPFAVTTELGHTPWNAEALLLRIGIRGYALAPEARPAANLVFLVDVSGSMQSPDKLPLLRNALRLLVDQLDGRDRVSMVVYAGASGVVLEPTRGDDRQTILDALARLEAGGSTNGAAGIRDAYALARRSYIENGVNRVVLATDGDFNVGTVDFESLVDLAERERKSGVALTTLGFGTGNLNDHLLERLADAGNGNYAYIDTIAEARKVLVEQLAGTLVTIAKDVKVQVEFNPAQVREYRLIGYENRALAREDFNNDQVDAGEIGAGHRVTALYEVVPVGAHGHIDPLRYGPAGATVDGSGELAFVRLRYKRPDEDVSRLIERPIPARALTRAGRESADFRFAASVAAFGQKLRGGEYLGSFGYEAIAALARASTGTDRDGYRAEFLELVAAAGALDAGRGEQVSRIESRN